MGKKGKKKVFIDKKKAATFHLIRAHPDAKTNFNLLPKQQGDLPVDFPTDLILGNAPVIEGADLPPPIPFGLLPRENDGGLVHDYDYSQHLMEMGEGAGILLYAPTGPNLSIRQSEKKHEPDEEVDDEGDEKIREKFEKELQENEREIKEDYIFNGDFLEALEGEAEGYEELADDFVFSAMEGEIPGATREETGSSHFQHFEIEEFDEEYEYPEQDELSDVDETREKRQIDVDFELLMKQYDDDEIGELDEEDPEVQGKVEDISEFKKVIDRQLIQQKEVRDPNELTGEEKKLTLSQVVRLEQQKEETQKDFEDDVESLYAQKPTEQWDCESIISTYSNVENHPHLVREPRRNAAKVISLSRDGLPLGVMSDRKRSHIQRQNRRGGRKEQELAQLEEGEEEEEHTEEEDEEDEEGEKQNLGRRRNKQETKAEKALRKKLAKQARQAARAKKKIVKGIYKREERKATRQRTKQQNTNPSALRL